MYTGYSTRLLPATERQGYWSDVINNAYFPLALDFRDPQRFHGQLCQWQLGELGLSQLSSSATRYRRFQQHISEAEPYFLITIPANAAVQFSQDNHKIVCKPGAFILERSDKPYEFSYSADNALWVIRIPTAVLRARLREPERYLYMEFDIRQGMGALFYEFMKSIVRQAAYMDASSYPALCNQLVDLLVLSLESDDRVIASNEAGLKSAHLRRIENYVRANIQNPELSPDLIAAACQISTRYLHKLFRDSDQTVGQWIKEVRLQSALRDIKGQCQHVTLAEVAYKWGFTDQAHFCRLFKARFGCTPREARQRG